jgi:hypothetical protein
MTDSVVADFIELERRVEDLRAFEREYRSRMLSYFRQQIRDLGEDAPSVLLRPGEVAVSGSDLALAYGALSDRIAAALEYLAGRDDDMPALVRALAHPSLADEDMTLAWAGYREAVIMRDALDGRTEHWSAAYDGEALGRGDRQDEAVQLKAAEADDALEVLVRGTTRGNGS